MKQIGKFIMYLALVVMAVAALEKHGAFVFDRLNLDPAILARLPNTERLVGLAMALAVLGLALGQFATWSANRKGSRAVKRQAFVKESLPSIGHHVNQHASEPNPDVPYIVDYVIFQAIEAGASDIHLDPFEEGYEIRFRVDGLMQDAANTPASLTGRIANRLKVVANLVVYEGFRPQDGRLNPGQGGQDANNRPVDFRIAFMPTLHGERIVIRILGRSTESVPFRDLGMTETQEEQMAGLLESVQGMIVLNGPTGSGKTTTIYTALQSILHREAGKRSIATLEDPIELDIPGINQAQLDRKKGFDFAGGLRALLRQDPDVIMVGEIRDTETAQIAVQAGMTGHLIITTVHANSSAATFARLTEMKVAPHALNSSLTAIVSQRLTRRNCPNCIQERPSTSADLEMMGLDPGGEKFNVFESHGCDSCGMSGYKDRLAIYEILQVTESLRLLIAEGASTDAVYNQARAEGMISLHQNGLNAVRRGLTTPAEIARTITHDLR